LVEGETLLQKIRHGSGLMAMAMAEANHQRSAISHQPLAIAIEGLVHEAPAIACQSWMLSTPRTRKDRYRDLKLANVKVTPDGVVKVLDFASQRWRLVTFNRRSRPWTARRKGPSSARRPT
jgi:hypothetical protein